MGVSNALGANLSAVVMDCESYVGGDLMDGLVLLDAPAPAGGVVVTLSDNTGSVNTPASVTVPEGKKGAKFQCTSVAVGTAATRLISASAGGITKNSLFNLLPVAVIQSLTLIPNELVGGDPFVGRITLNSIARKNGESVQLTKSSGIISIPSLWFVNPAGQKSDFNGQTQAVSADYVRTVTAKCNNVAKTANLLMHPAPVMVSVALRENIIKGGLQTGLIVHLSGFPRQQGSTITVTESSAFVTPSNPIIVKDKAAYGINTTAVTSAQVVEITCKLDNVTKKVTLVVTP